MAPAADESLSAAGILYISPKPTSFHRFPICAYFNAYFNIIIYNVAKGLLRVSADNEM